MLWGSLSTHWLAGKEAKRESGLPSQRTCMCMQATEAERADSLDCTRGVCSSAARGCSAGCCFCFILHDDQHQQQSNNKNIVHSCWFTVTTLLLLLLCCIKLAIVSFCGC